MAILIVLLFLVTSAILNYGRTENRTPISHLAKAGATKIKEDTANTSRVCAGRFVSLTFRTLVIIVSYPTGVSYPSSSGWERTHIGNTYFNFNNY